MSNVAADISDKVILITGGAKGIGGATAQLCAERNAVVIIADRDQEKGTDLAQELQIAGHRAYFYALDVRDENAVQALIAYIQEKHNRLDVLICSAGILEGASLQPDVFPMEIFDRVMDINVRGMFMCVKYAVPLLDQSENGCIILVGSVAGVLGGSSSIAYGASKGAVNGMGMALEHHLASRRIRVNVVWPGGIETDLKLRQMQAVAEAQGQPFDAVEAAQRLGSPRGVAKQIAYLASDDADYMRRNIITR
ncbi:MAG: SDR family oxidoreductase [Chloroflexota bacterium]